MFKLEDCYAKKLLSRRQPSLELADKSIAQASRFLEKAEKLINLAAEVKEPIVMLLYEALFHSARALLFKDGVRERSHMCVILYVQNKYSQPIDSKLIDFLFSIRSLRNDVQYSLEPVDINVNLKKVYGRCETFVGRVGDIVSAG